MKLTIVITLVLVLGYLGITEAWLFGGGDSGGGGNDRGVIDRAVDKVRSAKDFVVDAAKGAAAMGKAYSDMRDANWKNSDKYFHARGNHDAAKHGAGGKWAAEKISNAREWVDRNIKGDSAASSAADQAANKWGRSGGNPDKYRPKGLPKKFRK